MAKKSKVQKLKESIGLTTLNDDDCMYNYNTYSDTGNYVINAMLSGRILGGVPHGETVMFSGDPSTGKSFILTKSAVTFLRENDEHIIFYLDTEGSIMKSIIPEDVRDRFLIKPTRSVEALKGTIEDLVNIVESGDVEKGKVQIYLDSLGNLSSLKEIDDAKTKSNKNDMTRQRVLHSFFRLYLIPFRELNIPFVISNHVYESIGGYGNSKTHKGGQGSVYAGSTVLQLSKKKKKKSGKLVGFTVTMKFNSKDKSRRIKSDVSGQISIDFSGGIHRFSGLVEFLYDIGIIEKTGQKYRYKDIEGRISDFRKAFVKFLNENPDELKALDELVFNEIAFESSKPLVNEDILIDEDEVEE